MRTRPRLAVSLLAVAVLLGACKGRDNASKKADESASGGGQEQSNGAETAVHSVGTKTPTLTLLQPGEEPRRVVTYGSGSGTRKVRVEVEMIVPGAPPDTKITFDLEVLFHPRGTGAGNARRFRVSEVRLDPGQPPPSPGEREVIDAIAAMFGKVEGQVSSEGPHHFAFVQTAGMATTPSLPWLLHALVVPLPIHPVGKGARWSFLQPNATADGLPGVDKRMYELAGLDDSSAVVTMSGQTVYNVEARKQPPSEIRLLGAELTVHGELHVGFVDPVPVSGELTMEQEMTWSARPSGALPHEQGPEEQVVRSTVRVRLSSE